MSATTGASRPIVMRSPMPVAAFKPSANSRSIVSPTHDDNGIFSAIKQMIKLRRGGVQMQQASPMDEFDGKKPSWTNGHDGHRELMRTMTELKEGGGGVRGTVKAGWNRRAIASVAKAFGGARKSMKPRSSQKPALPPRPLGALSETDFDSASTMGNMSPSPMSLSSPNSRLMTHSTQVEFGIASYDHDSDASDTEGEKGFESEQEIESYDNDSNVSGFEAEQESEYGNDDEDESDSEYEIEMEAVDEEEEVDRKTYFVGHNIKGSVMFTSSDGSETSTPTALLQSFASMSSETDSHMSGQQQEEEEQQQQDSDFEESESEFGGVTDSVMLTSSYTSDMSLPSFRSESLPSMSGFPPPEHEPSFRSEAPISMSDYPPPMSDYPGPPPEHERESYMFSEGDDVDPRSRLLSSIMPPPPRMMSSVMPPPRMVSSVMPPPLASKNGMQQTNTEESDLPFGMPFGFRASSPDTPEHLRQGMDSPTRPDVPSSDMDSYRVYKGGDGVSVRDPQVDVDENASWYDDVTKFDVDVDDQQQEHEQEESVFYEDEEDEYEDVAPLSMRAPSVQAAKPKSGRAGMFDAINAMRTPSVATVATPTQAPAEQQQSSSPPASANGEDYSKYYTMLKIGLPEGAVAQAMARDGVDESGFDFSFEG